MDARPIKTLLFFLAFVIPSVSFPCAWEEIVPDANQSPSVIFNLNHGGNRGPYPKELNLYLQSKDTGGLKSDLAIAVNSIEAVVGEPLGSASQPLEIGLFMGPHAPNQQLVGVRNTNEVPSHRYNVVCCNQPRQRYIGIAFPEQDVSVGRFRASVLIGAGQYAYSKSPNGWSNGGFSVVEQVPSRPSNKTQQLAMELRKEIQGLTREVSTQAHEAARDLFANHFAALFAKEFGMEPGKFATPAEKSPLTETQREIREALEEYGSTPETLAAIRDALNSGARKFNKGASSFVEAQLAQELIQRALSGKNPPSEQQLSEMIERYQGYEIDRAELLRRLDQILSESVNATFRIV